MDVLIAHWYILAIVGIILFSIGIFVYKEGSKNWLVANADLTIALPGLVFYIAGLCMLFSQL